MKRTLIILGFFLIFISYANSQDIIYQKNGSKVSCRILREDSASVYFDVRLKDRYASTFLKKTEIDSVEYVTNTGPNKSKVEIVSIGMGMGLDYGGIGGNIALFANNNIGVFGGLGYVLGMVGYNAGFKLKLVSGKHTSGFYPYILGMYGYNAAIKIKGVHGYDRLYNGPTLGFGFDIRNKATKMRYCTLALIVPFRDSEVDQYIHDMERMGATFSRKLRPVLFSFGYRIIIN